MFIDDQDTNIVQDETLGAEQNVASDELAKCNSELKSIKDSYAFMLADFENYKKRAAKDNERMLFNAQIGIIIKFLPIVDNVSRFIKTVDKADQSSDKANDQVDLKSWRDGLVLVEREIQKIFESLGIKEVQLVSFDPEIHEAIAYVHVEGKEPGSIVDYIEKGYTYKGALLRAAKVAVSQ